MKHQGPGQVWITSLASALLVLAVTACGDGAGDGDAAGDVTTSQATDSTISSTSTTESVVTTSSPGTETTSPATQPGDVLVLGDWGSGTLPQGAVAGAMMRYAEENEVAAVLTTGDNFYSDDADFLMEPFWWATEAGLPFWITWGIHDVESEARVEAVNSAFDEPPRWTVHQWGRIDVVILDSTQISSQQQQQFLEETMADHDPTIVVFHSPMYSCGSRAPEPEVLERWAPLFDNDVFLVLNGHDHNYQRFDAGEVAYVVSGGGGQSLTEISECPEDAPALVASSSTHHYVVLEQDTESVQVSALDVNGEILDMFTTPLP